GRDRELQWGPVGAVGDCLALCRLSVAASGTAGRTFDVGPYEKEEVDLLEVDTDGRYRSSQVFASRHLGDAVVRLYERYAELLPEGPARARAAAIARSAALTLQPFDLDRLPAALAPDIEVLHHQTLGTWSAHGAEEWLRHWRSLFDLANVTVRDDDVLALQPDALLVSRIFRGTDHTSGGAWEAGVLALLVFGVNGLIAR